MIARISLALLTLTAGASAHHILGIPHYAYDESYPQTPILTYVVEVGGCEIKMTGYPGVPKPGERCDLHVYVRELRSGRLFSGEITMTVFRDDLFGEDPAVYGPVKASLDGALFRFHPHFDDEANYLVRIEFFAADEPYTVDLPMVVGEPGSPWAVLGGVVGGFVILLVLVRAVKIKRTRMLGRKEAPPQEGVAKPSASDLTRITLPGEVVEKPSATDLTPRPPLPGGRGGDASINDVEKLIDSVKHIGIESVSTPSSEGNAEHRRLQEASS